MARMHWLIEITFSSVPLFLFRLPHGRIQRNSSASYSSHTRQIYRNIKHIIHKIHVELEKVNVSKREKESAALNTSIEMHRARCIIIAFCFQT